MQLHRIVGHVSGFRTSRAFTLFTLCLFSAGGLTRVHAEIANSARKQMREIASLKQSLTPAEQKMSFDLVLLERDAKHTLPADLKHLVSSAVLNSSGEAVVSVKGSLTPSLLSNALLQGVDTVDGQVPAGAVAAGRVRAHVAPRKLAELAALPEVQFLSAPERFVTNAGSLTSQGYVSHGANTVIAGGIDGTGVNVGVLSDSASPARVAALIASGDLPANVTVLPGQAGSGEDEGTAMMEIVHDMAPGANLFFATADPSPDQMAANIRNLRNQYHCDIIVDDITYLAEPAFQDGTIAQAVNDVTADGALYFSSAANSGNLTSGTSGTWEGDFVPGPSVDSVGTYHNFGTASAPVFSDVLKAGSSFISMQWADPLGGAADDYDLYVLNPAGTSVVAVSANEQNGTQNPIEYVSGTFPAGDQVVAFLYQGSKRALRFDTARGQLTIATSGSTFGHNAAASTYTVAAVYWNSAHHGVRPFTGGASNPVETFSSDGLRKIFFNPNGTAITPGNFLFSTNGGTTLQKPDGAAADGVITATPGFNPFFGTSAAAPHAAGIAALVKQANRSLTNTQIRQILDSTALDDMAPGVDRDTGWGILMAPAAVATAKSQVQ